jgi:hypothetical protein
MSTRGAVPVLYVGSWGRSGSTLLDLMLGRLPGFVSVGELRYLWERGLEERQRCGCGLPVPECPFWRAVLDTAFPGGRRGEADAVVHLWRRTDGLGRVPALAAPWRPAAYGRDVAAFREILGRVYAAVRAVSGAETVVDSSKYAAYGLLLAGAPGIDLTVLHLVRDSRAVAYSWTRRKPMPEVSSGDRYMPLKGPGRSAGWWALENLALHLLRRAAARSRLLRYEDLAADPRAALARVLGPMGVDLHVLEPLAAGRLMLGENHTVAGNPVRFHRGELAVAPDTEWREGLAPAPRRLVTAMTWPLLLGYGFPLRH